MLSLQKDGKTHDDSRFGEELLLLLITNLNISLLLWSTVLSLKEVTKTPVIVWNKLSRRQLTI